MFRGHLWEWSFFRREMILPLEINPPPLRVERGFHNGLCQGGMRVHRPAQLRRGCLQRPGQASLGDEIRGTIADDMAAKELAILLVHHELDESLFVAGGNRLSYGTEGKLAELDLIPP